MFFSERRGIRGGPTTSVTWDTDPVGLATGATKTFWKAYATMKAPNTIIDQSGAGAKEAREMSVEFISKNSQDFGSRLKAFLASVP